jgi:hypothetical protein
MFSRPDVAHQLTWVPSIPNPPVEAVAVRIILE